MAGIFSETTMRTGLLPKGTKNPYIGTTLPKPQLRRGNNAKNNNNHETLTHRIYNSRKGAFKNNSESLPQILLPYNPEMMAHTGAGGIQPDFPQGDTGQPFWFSNIGGNHFPREGFTYQPFDKPLVSLSDQLQGYIDDEDAQMGINFLAANTTGGSHYFKGKTDTLVSHIEDFAKKIKLDRLAWAVSKELLAYGNSFWRLRKPIWQVTSFKDFQHLPIDSFARVWWTPDRRPIWYEFRGASYNGYFRPEEILHFVWNPINAQILGFGMMSQLVKEVLYTEQTPDGGEDMVRMPYLDIKHGMQNLVYRSMYRYVPRNLYEAPASDEAEREDIREAIRNLFPGEDLVTGSKGMKVTEMGSGIRAYEPNSYMDLFQGAIFKALQTSKGRIAGQSQGPTYANGEESAILDEIGLSFFPIDLADQFTEFILKPWYWFNQKKDPMVAGGLVEIPWEHTDLELKFGKAIKKDLEPDQLKDWIELLGQHGAITPKEIRKAGELANVPLQSDEEGNLPLDNPTMQGIAGPQPNGMMDPNVMNDPRAQPLTNKLQQSMR